MSFSQKAYNQFSSDYAKKNYVRKLMLEEFNKLDETNKARLLFSLMELSQDKKPDELLKIFCNELEFMP